ncbi:MAG: GTP-binding protein, partial [Clostridia bacterium]|nr:GTP-binding protein [Clostridia bacterium]
LGDERCIVSDMPGTTRDAIDTYFENDHGKYNFIDTAGIRRQSRVDDRVEKISVLRAKMAVDRADVCLIMIDANEGITEQDEKIAGIAHEAGKPSIICINKWDLIDKDNNTTNEFTKKVYDALSYMTYAPILFLSAKTGQRVEKLFEQINYVNMQSKLRVTTGMLNDVLADAVARVQPPSDKGRRLKLYYMTESEVAPPTFVVFCNNAELFHFSYQRYLENCLRQTFGFRGTPIKLIIRQRGDNEDQDFGGKK